MTLTQLTPVFIFSFILSSILMGASYILTFKNLYWEKVTAYECGFAPIRYPNQPFSIRFFLVGIIFLIFDLEVMYLVPWAISHNSLSIFSNFMVVYFILFMVIGLIYEWHKGGLEWI